MNAQMTTSYDSYETSPLQLVKSDLKYFNVQYLRTLNLITATGWSITDDAWIKYYQLLADIESQMIHSDELTVYFKLELFNTSSARYILKIINRLNKGHANGKKVKIYWSTQVENEAETMDASLELSGLCDFPFEIYAC
ncbi:SiaC family regulatory phosphoprotein [Ekhidna sp.]|uniref:SiaC family regulatory phosphoprotein n=1 Tax=Ekhidna sp. TaxID=2608089 RepID=UPI00329882AC